MADNINYDLFQKVEKWTTREKFNALDLSTIETGTEYNLAGPIDETDLDSALQSKINGKLTAPTTPTADSAITMLADGTVGTKPLSEIGGKIYEHYIMAIIGDYSCHPIVYSHNSNAMTQDEFKTLISGKYLVVPGEGTTANDRACLCFTSGTSGYTIIGIVNNGGVTKYVNTSSTAGFFSDTVTEL